MEYTSEQIHRQRSVKQKNPYLALKLQLMKKNVGKKDKMIRLLVATLIAVAVIFELIPEPLNYVGFAISLILLLTSTLNFCPLYALLGKNTCERE